MEISIHALLAESDSVVSSAGTTGKSFLSTLSLRRATSRIENEGPSFCISIHALLAESDFCLLICVSWMVHFYPRSPCGERHIRSIRKGTTGNFYPRSPCGERLWPGLLARPFFIISIHALLAESDVNELLEQSASYSISIHALLAESDFRFSAFDFFGFAISIHALLAESDFITTITTCTAWKFLSTLSLRRATCYSLRHSA